MSDVSLTGLTNLVGTRDEKTGRLVRRVVIEYSAEDDEPHSVPECDLILQRLGQDNESTTGVLLLNRDLRVHKRGEVVCHILEDEHREEKVHGRTRIPAGVYILKRVTVSGILNSMRRWFPELGFIVGLLDVPAFDYVRIHTGIRHEHTEGCLLVGAGALNSWKTSPEEATLADTRGCYRALHHEVFEPMFDANPTPKLWVRDESYLLGAR